MIDEYFKDRRKIRKIKAISEYQLLITFDNDEKRIVNLSEEITATESVFNVLQDINIFNTVFLNENGNPAWVTPELELEIDADNCYLDSEF